MSHVYFVKAEGPDLIKIGHAKNIRNRILSLCSISPVPIELLAHMPGGKSEEHHLHIRLAEHRHHGEWFTSHPCVLTEVQHAKEHFDQALPLVPIERFGRRVVAARYITDRWRVDEDAAFEILRGRNSIYLAIDYGRYREADALIENAIKCGNTTRTSLDEFNSFLRAGP